MVGEGRVVAAWPASACWPGLLLWALVLLSVWPHLCRPRPVSGTTMVQWPDRAMARAEPGLDYQTTRFGGPQPDPVSRLRLPSYGCGAVWPRSLQLDAVCQVAAVFCPDLFWAACVHEIRPCNN